MDRRSLGSLNTVSGQLPNCRLCAQNPAGQSGKRWIKHLRPSQAVSLDSLGRWCSAHSTSAYTRQTMDLTRAMGKGTYGFRRLMDSRSTDLYSRRTEAVRRSDSSIPTIAESGACRCNTKINCGQSSINLATWIKSAVPTTRHRMHPLTQRGSSRLHWGADGIDLMRWG